MPTYRWSHGEKGKTTPKNTDATKSKMRSRSTRKPLRDVSNAKIAVKAAGNFEKTSEEDCGQKGADSLDRLLLVHSEISSILRQIDELVVQALQLTSNDREKEIKQFADLLSDMQASLKPWVPRFEKALSSQSKRPENKPEQSIDQAVVCVPEESSNAFIESPEHTKWESLVSPSPLVSWRAELNKEGGRQLFLLTPLPKTKTISSKCQASSIPAFRNVTSEEIAPQTVSLLNSVGNLGNDMPEGVSAKPPANKAWDVEVDKAVGNLESTCASPAKYSKQQCPAFVITPCLKMSPPKSCMLLEPVSALSRKNNQGVHISTSLPAGVQNSSSGEPLEPESINIQSSNVMKVKYPELFGIKMNTLGNRKVAEDSPNWIASPPKTCIIMEPSEEKSLNNVASNCLLPKTTAVHNQQDDHGIASKTHLQDINRTLDLAESTPMLKAEPTSSFRLGKRPGENTLKKELWTKFEAATTHGIRFNPSILQNITKKGFLDQLEEASDP